MQGQSDSEAISESSGRTRSHRTEAVGAPPREGWRLYQTIRYLLRWLRWWARLEAKGLENLPLSGPVLIVSNHDAWLDPLVMVEAMMWRERQLRFLAKSTLWKFPPIAWILDGAGQIPIRRGKSDRAALEAAVDALGRGEAIGIFPEGTLSRGDRLRARRGVSRLAQACPEVPVVLVAVEGGTDLKRFPRRPRVKIDFFEPAGGQARPEEDPAELAARLLDEIRERVPPTH
jgi:1-acyl-sn-glycerol-3-phosphate acyltransferase